MGEADDTSAVRLAVPVSSVFVISVPFFRCLPYYVAIPTSLANNYVAKKKKKIQPGLHTSVPLIFVLSDI